MLAIIQKRKDAKYTRSPNCCVTTKVEDFLAFDFTWMRGNATDLNSRDTLAHMCRCVIEVDDKGAAVETDDITFLEIIVSDASFVYGDNRSDCL